MEPFLARIRQVRDGREGRPRVGDIEELSAEGVDRPLLAVDPMPYDDTAAAIAGLSKQVRPLLGRP